MKHKIKIVLSNLYILVKTGHFTDHIPENMEGNIFTLFVYSQEELWPDGGPSHPAPLCPVPHPCPIYTIP